MKIAFLNNLYFPYNRGGAEQVVANLVEEKISAGQTVFVITTKANSSDDFKLSEAANNYQTYYLPSRYLELAEHSVLWRAVWHLINLFNLKKYSQLKKILLKEKPDLIITHNLMGLGFLTPRLIRRLKIKHEHFLHDIQLLHPSGLMIYGQEKKINSWLAKIYQGLTRCLFNSPEKVSSPSAWLLEQHRQRGFFKNSNLELAPFKKITSFSDFSSARQTNNFKNFLFVGQIETHKGIFLLLEAFKEVTNPDLNLTIVGDGQALEAAKKLGAADKRLKFLGRLPQSEIEKIMSLNDALIVPSLCYENSPTIIYEAHEVNLPVIATNLGGIPEITKVKDQLFKPEVEELTKILKNLV